VDKEVFMTGMEKGNEHRVSKRMDRALLILLPDQEGEIVNISASGVCFEVITNDINAFSLGTTIPIEINATTFTPGLEERDVRLKGKGSVVRNDIKDVTRRGNRLRVALEFKEKFDIFLN
jgi:hypothetical protein